MGTLPANDVYQQCLQSLEKERPPASRRTFAEKVELGLWRTYGIIQASSASEV